MCSQKKNRLWNYDWLKEKIRVNELNTAMLKKVKAFFTFCQSEGILMIDIFKPALQSPKYAWSLPEYQH